MICECIIIDDVSYMFFKVSRLLDSLLHVLSLCQLVRL